MTSDMRMKLIHIILPVLLLCSCGNNKEAKVAGKPGKDQMEELNRFMIRKDRERILNYIERKGLKMTETPTGLWYQVTREGEGTKFTDNSRIMMEYDCSLLDGTLCYSSKDTGPKQIILGRSSLEPGLNQGLRLVSPGAEAIFIIPPFLAYGLPGDGKKIPPRSVLVYSVKILKGE